MLLALLVVQHEALRAAPLRLTRRAARAALACWRWWRCRSRSAAGSAPTTRCWPARGFPHCNGAVVAADGLRGRLHAAARARPRGAAAATCRSTRWSRSTWRIGCSPRSCWRRWLRWRWRLWRDRGEAARRCGGAARAACCCCSWPAACRNVVLGWPLVAALRTPAAPRRWCCCWCCCSCAPGRSAPRAGGRRARAAAPPRLGMSHGDRPHPHPAPRASRRARAGRSTWR